MGRFHRRTKTIEVIIKLLAIYCNWHETHLIVSFESLVASNLTTGLLSMYLDFFGDSSDIVEDSSSIMDESSDIFDD